MMNNKKWEMINPNEIYSIPNLEMKPIFKLILSDKGWNYYDFIPNGWSNFTLKISNPDTNINMEFDYEFF